MRGVATLLAVLLFAGTAAAQSPATALAPTGTLRAAINFGNPVLAAELARRLRVPLTVVPFDSAGSVTSALGGGSYDIAFLAIDPVRGQGLDFTAPYVLIEGGYAVRKDAPFGTIDSVDAAGVTVAVATGSAYDLFLSRALKHATLVRLPTGNDAAAAFIAGQNDVLAGVKAPLAQLVGQTPGMRLLPGRFMAIEQAMALPKGRDGAALAFLQGFITEMKANGTVARALAETGQPDAQVAP